MRGLVAIALALTSVGSSALPTFTEDFPTGTFTTSNVNIQLVDLTPDDGIAPSLTGMTVDELKTHLQAVESFDVPAALGPNSALVGSFDYAWSLSWRDYDGESIELRWEFTACCAFSGFDVGSIVRYGAPQNGPFTGAAHTQTFSGSFSFSVSDEHGYDWAFGVLFDSLPGLVPAIPEPSTTALFLPGMLLMAALSRRRDARQQQRAATAPMCVIQA
jgi:hypothetical protein